MLKWTCTLKPLAERVPITSFDKFHHLLIQELYKIAEERYLNSIKATETQPLPNLDTIIDFLPKEAEHLLSLVLYNRETDMFLRTMHD